MTHGSKRMNTIYTSPLAFDDKVSEADCDDTCVQISLGTSNRKKTTSSSGYSLQSTSFSQLRLPKADWANCANGTGGVLYMEHRGLFP